MIRKLLIIVLFPAVVISAGRDFAATRPAPTSKSTEVGEQIPSEDSVVKDFHCLGLVDGRTVIFRGACPVRDLAK